MRKIKFNAYIEIGDNKEIRAIIPDVTVYGEDGRFGCSFKKFNRALEDTGYYFDGDCFMRLSSVTRDENDEYHIDMSPDIDAGEFNVISGDDWVYFDGIPLQYTGLEDNKGNSIYEGDIVMAYNSIPRTGIKKQVVWKEGKFVFEQHDKDFQTQTLASSDCEVLSNIYMEPTILT